MQIIRELVIELNIANVDVETFMENFQKALMQNRMYVNLAKDLLTIQQTKNEQKALLYRAAFWKASKIESVSDLPVALFNIANCLDAFAKLAGLKINETTLTPWQAHTDFVIQYFFAWYRDEEGGKNPNIAGLLDDGCVKGLMRFMDRWDHHADTVPSKHELIELISYILKKREFIVDKKAQIDTFIQGNYDLIMITTIFMTVIALSLALFKLWENNKDSIIKFIQTQLQLVRLT